MTGLSGRWLEHEVFFSYNSTDKAWYAIAGVSLETRPGKYPLDLRGAAAGGKQLTFQRKIGVGRARYPHVAVTVAKQFTEPNPDQLRKIDEDKGVKEAVFSRAPTDRQWAGEFQAPVNARVSDVFGTARTFNGQVQGVHQGLDYAVGEGTPVAALNRGTVVLVRSLYFEGNFIVVDHGQGLLSLYMHLSKMEVKEGDQVTAGQRIAMSGGTGRATGPHLHVAVRWQGIYVNPATLLTLKLP